MARAKRIEREGLRPRDVPCPHCGAPAFVSSKRDPGYCRTPQGNPLRGHEDHKKRVEEAARLKARILREGEEARRMLGPEETKQRSKEPAS